MEYYVKETKTSYGYRQDLFRKGERPKSLYSQHTKETTYSKIYGGDGKKKGKHGYDIIKEFMVRDYLNYDPLPHHKKCSCDVCVEDIPLSMDDTDNGYTVDWEYTGRLYYWNTPDGGSVVSIHDKLDILK